MKKFTKLTSLVLALIMTVSLFAACGKASADTDDTEAAQGGVDVTQADEGGDQEAAKAEYDAMTAEDLVKKYVADPKAITVQEYANLLSTYAFVATTDEYEFESGNKTDEALKLIKDAGGELPRPHNDELYPIMLANPNEYVRSYFYRLFSSFTGDKDSAIFKALLDSFKKEGTNPFVINSMIYGLSRTLGEDKEFCDFLMEHAKSEDAVIRKTVSSRVNYFNGPDHDAYVQTILALFKDADENIRNNAMKNCWPYEDDAFVQPLSAVLADDAQINSHGAAAESLIRMWYGHHSEAAYKATLEFFKRECADPKYPNWTSVNMLATKCGGYDKWLEGAAYFDAAEVVEIMKQLVGDAEAQKLVKTSAVKVVGLFGTADDLNALKPLVEDSPDKNDIIKEIDKQLEKK